MKRKTLIVLLFVFIFVTGLVWAQTNAPGTNAPATSAGGSSLSLSSIPSWLQVLITPITLGLCAAVRKYLPRIPANVLPFVVPFVGAALNVLSDLIGLWGNQGLVSSALAGAALGGLATWVHQLGKQSGVVPPSDE